ncbi:hypothetical protein OEZ86_009734 [Tetradesmus obliquus]|uniref:Flavin reductase like domain-containing protein n=1 Tax=Tetradesmus obliquus TaxID=3088 RepID=A0ABY8UMV1_TETOB|nr:hypothetical protein OEZ85_001177 [Tetradesmus obliquus]WIA43228.1 hypothetical protein OEZ86_009734 [Tetradesmus obliquus]
MALHVARLARPTSGTCPCAQQTTRQARLVTRLPALSGIPDTELPPYALLSTPVYSLSSANAAGKTTLNMITYASPIALRPQRKYALGLYVQSMSYQNVKETGRAVLQILQEPHAKLTQLLGKTSGRDVDKVAQLQQQGFAVSEEYGLPVLADAVGVMELKVVSDFIPAGDHEVVVCDVVAWKQLQEDSSSAQPLYSGFLRDNGFL